MTGEGLKQQEGENENIAHPEEFKRVLHALLDDVSRQEKTRIAAKLTGSLAKFTERSKTIKTHPLFNLLKNVGVNVGQENMPQHNTPAEVLSDGVTYGNVLEEYIRVADDIIESTQGIDDVTNIYEIIKEKVTQAALEVQCPNCNPYSIWVHVIDKLIDNNRLNVSLWLLQKISKRILIDMAHEIIQNLSEDNADKLAKSGFLYTLSSVFEVEFLQIYNEAKQQRQSSYDDEPSQEQKVDMEIFVKKLEKKYVEPFTDFNGLYHSLKKILKGYAENKNEKGVDETLPLFADGSHREMLRGDAGYLLAAAYMRAGDSKSAEKVIEEYVGCMYDHYAQNRYSEPRAKYFLSHITYGLRLLLESNKLSQKEASEISDMLLKQIDYLPKKRISWKHEEVFGYSDSDTKEGYVAYILEELVKECANT